MTRKHISQATARAWQKRLYEAERKLNDLNRRWHDDYGGHHLSDVTTTPTYWWIVHTAQRCGRAVVVRASEGGDPKLKLYAMDV